MASVGKMLRNQRSAKEEIFRKEDVFYGGGANPPAQINGWECLFWLIRGISQSWHLLMSLFLLTILTGQGHISELSFIFWGSKGIADWIAMKRRRLFWHYPKEEEEVEEEKNDKILQAKVSFLDYLLLSPGRFNFSSECGILTPVDESSIKQIFSNL